MKSIIFLREMKTVVSFFSLLGLALAGPTTTNAQLTYPPPDCGADGVASYQGVVYYNGTYYPEWVCEYPLDKSKKCPDSGASGSGGAKNGESTPPYRASIIAGENSGGCQSCGDYAGTGVRRGEGNTGSSTGGGSPVNNASGTGNGEGPLPLPPRFPPKPPGGPKTPPPPPPPDCPCEEPEGGMPHWSIMEPSLAFFLSDKPFFYNTSQGREVVFQLTFKGDPGPNGAIDTAQPGIFSVGTNWHSPWRSYIYKTLTGHNHFPAAYFVFLGDGSASQYLLQKTGQGEDLADAKLIYDDANSEYMLRFPSGSMNVYGKSVTLGANDYIFLSRKIDPAGNSLSFTYTTNGTGSVVLNKVADADGNETTFVYTNNAYYSNLLAEVRGPYGLTNKLTYSSGGRLTNIIDVAEIPSGIGYDNSNRVSTLTTPYGTTSISYLSGGTPAWKALRVDEFGLRKHLYLSGYDASDVFPNGQSEALSLSNYLASANLASFVEAFGFDERNTFHWGPRQYQSLPQSIQNSLTNVASPSFDPSNLTTNDLQLGWTHHWLKVFDSTDSLVSEQLSWERMPSPVNDGGIAGRVVWYDYQGKTSADRVGTFRRPSVTAWRQPGEMWRVQYVSEVNDPPATRTVAVRKNGSWLGWQYHEDQDLFWWGWESAFTTNWVTTTYKYAENRLDVEEVKLSYITYALPSTAFNSNLVEQAVERVVSHFEYNGNHQVITGYNALNESTIYEYNANHNLAKVTRPGGHITEYSYDANGWPSSVVDKASGGQSFRTNTFTYSNGRMASLTDERGLTVNYVWDALGRLVRQVYPDSTGVTNIFYKFNVIAVHDRMGFVNGYAYNAFGQVLRHTNANHQVTTKQYCDCGSLESVIDPLGNTTRFTYDNLGRRIRITLPGGSWNEFEYDLLDQVVRITDNGGAYVTNAYNLQGFLAWSGNEIGIVSRYLYDIEGHATNIANGDGVENFLQYDALGRVVYRANSAAPNPSAPYESNIYSARGLVAHYDASNHMTLFKLDELGRRMAETNANDEVTQFTYTAAGDLHTVTDARNHVTTWNYDEYGRVTNKLDAVNNVVFRYTYDANGRLKTRWTPGTNSSIGLTTEYSYDAVGNQTNINYPNNADITLEYDADNRLVTITDGVGNTRFTYTAFGALLSEDGPWASDTVNYAYSDQRLRQSLRLHQLNASDWVQNYAYDSIRRLTNTASPAGAFGYQYLSGEIWNLEGAMWENEYDPLPSAGEPLSGAGTLVSRVDLPGGAWIQTTHDARVRLTSTVLKNAGGTVLNQHDYEVDNLNLRTRQTRLDGSYVDYGYDSIGQLTSTTGKESGGSSRAHEQLGYAYDEAGNLQWRTNNALIQQFNVNNLNELTTIGRSGTFTVAGVVQGSPTDLTLADNGNPAQSATAYGDLTFTRENITLNNGTNTFVAVATDAYGRTDTNIVTANLPATVTLAYDLNGNLRTNGTLLLDYDDENQLIRVTEPGGWKSEFTYDGKMRRRVRKEYVWSSGLWSLTSETRYVYDGKLVIQERNGINLPQVTYTRGRDLSGTLEGSGGIGGLLSRTDNRLLQSGTPNAHAYYHCDGNGNITALVNISGTIVARYLYDPFGNTLSAIGPIADVNLYRFSSKELHVASGMVYFLYRFYEPSKQRWLNRDPIGEISAINLFEYCRNASTKEIDRFGLCGNLFDCSLQLKSCLDNAGSRLAQRTAALSAAFNNLVFGNTDKFQAGVEAICVGLADGNEDSPLAINCRMAARIAMGQVRNAATLAYNSLLGVLGAAYAAESAACGLAFVDCMADTENQPPHLP